MNYNKSERDDKLYDLLSTNCHFSYVFLKLNHGFILHTKYDKEKPVNNPLHFKHIHVRLVKYINKEILISIYISLLDIVLIIYSLKQYFKTNINGTNCVKTISFSTVWVSF